MASRIDRIGLEIEGGWAGRPGISPFKDVVPVKDDSINGQTLNGFAPIRATHVGEVVSPPIPYLPNETWEEWLLAHWPNAEEPHRTNRTCGYHIHLSFFSLKDYTLLSSKVFLFRLRSLMATLGELYKIPKVDVFWERMGGANTFCTLNFSAGKQMELMHKEGIHRQRYGWLNFATGIHGTVEFRALPTFSDPKLALTFTKAYTSFVEEYLEKVKDSKIEREATF